jgi:hypothetical protein
MSVRRIESIVPTTILRTWVKSANNQSFHEINNVKNTIGFNSYNKRYNNCGITTHAEMDCMKRLAFKMCKIRQRYITVDRVVLKVSHDGTLRNSQPCFHCMTELHKNKKINIHHLYFSNGDGKVEKHDFQYWCHTTTHHISCGWRRKNKK